MEPTRPIRTSSRRFRRRAGALAAMCALVAAACGSSPPTSGGEGGGRVGAGEGEGETAAEFTCPVEALDAADGPVEIDLWYGGLGGETQTVMEEMAETFNSSQDQVVVTVNSQGPSYQEVQRKYEGAAATPDQLPQIIYLEDTTLGAMVDRGQIMPAEACMDADDYDKNQILPAVRAAGSVDGVMYPGYMNVSTPILYYNKSIFSRAGLDPENPPGTLEEVVEAAQVIKDAGLAERPLAFLASRWYFENWVNGAGQDFVNNDNGRSATPTEAAFNTPEALEALQTLDQMNDDGLLNPFAFTEGSIDHYLSLLPPDDGNPTSAMLMETSTASTTIAGVVEGQISAADAGVDFDDSVVDRAALVPGAGPFPGINAPGRVNAGGGYFYILSTASDEQQAASWEYLKFMLQPENVKTWHTVGGYLPILKDAIDDPELDTYWTETLSGVILKNSVDQLRDADPDQASPLIGPAEPVRMEVQGMMERILLNGTDPQAELDSTEQAVNGILDDYNE